MNETVRLLQAHHSSRSYKTDPIPEEILEAIIECAHRAPTSTNSQEVSLVVVRDAAKRARIAEIAGGQPWIAQAPVFIAVIVDFYKTGLGVEKAGAAQVFQRSLEGILAAVSDVGIAMATLMTAARAFGLGIVPIGGIRRDPQAMIDLLDSLLASGRWQNQQLSSDIECTAVVIRTQDVHRKKKRREFVRNSLGQVDGGLG